MFDESLTEGIFGLLSGYLTVAGNSGQVLNAMVSPVPAQISYVVAAAQGGGTTTVLDVTLNGSSIWTNPSDRPTLVGANSGKFVSGKINHSAVQPGDVLALTVLTAGNKAQLVATVALKDPRRRNP
jgi:hypothetical protein